MKITLMEIAIMSKCRVKMPQHESCLSYILGENSFPLKNKVSCPKKTQESSCQLTVSQHGARDLLRLELQVGNLNKNMTSNADRKYDLDSNHI